MGRKPKLKQEKKLFRKELRKELKKTMDDFYANFKPEDVLKPKPWWMPRMIYNLMVYLIVKK